MPSSWTSYISCSSHKNNWMKCRLTFCYVRKGLSQISKYGMHSTSIRLLLWWPSLDVGRSASTTSSSSIFLNGSNHSLEHPVLLWLTARTPFPTDTGTSSLLKVGLRGKRPRSLHRLVPKQYYHLGTAQGTEGLCLSCVTYYPFTPAYAQTITKSQGQNIKHLIIWSDSSLVPPGTAYV